MATDRNVPNYKLVRDPEPEINEYCIRVPFHNQGRLHTSPLVYYHMLKDNLDEEKLTD